VAQEEAAEQADGADATVEVATEDLGAEEEDLLGEDELDEFVAPVALRCRLRSSGRRPTRSTSCVVLSKPGLHGDGLGSAANGAQWGVIRTPPD
jgi:hypothetical protein